MIAKLLHWLFACESPMGLYGFWPIFVWIVFMIVAGSMFGLLEPLGIRRVHGMIPLTWFWRCAPRAIWFVFAALAIWHFAFVTTRVK